MTQDATTLDDLEALTRRDLITLWQVLYRKDPPKGLSRAFLIKVLACEFQAKQSGGLPAKLRRQILRKGQATQTRRKKAVAPGTRLIRDWNRETHVVDVLEKGFRYNGETWASLTAIAEAITGAHWSGPRFFGVSS